jgi:hypothetical protein
VQIPLLDPMALVPAMAYATTHLGSSRKVSVKRSGMRFGSRDSIIRIAA